MRFLGGLAIGWVSLRVLMLWPGAEPVRRIVHEAAPILALRDDTGARVETFLPPEPLQPRVRYSIWPQSDYAPPPALARLPYAPQHAGPIRAGDPGRTALALLAFVRFGPPEDEAALPPPLVPGVPQPAPPGAARNPSRLSGSFWLVARDGSGASNGVIGGQLGGSQAGLRLAYALTDNRRVAIAGRVTSPLGPGLKEAAIGVEWQPTRLPVRIVAEQRFALNGGKSGPAIGVVGGFGPLPVAQGFRLEGYGQAGAIHRGDTQGYVDGALRLSREIVKLGPVPVALGAGLWGGAQRGAERLDIGPSVSAAIPIVGRTARLSLDWRQRVAGNAAPNSGVALTLGTDF
ncbi:hypothetical protein [Sphingomonas immobilis]|uniref:Haemolysin activator HlyB C-terminal domain-containing protein n=1 Tax=Sphingomonas immobilis TaxID=3063997 RepID=A0ABT8ZUV5_9SPHN|nr:hypothetical protein [Sphingomonas sp. CA1-15]MDO7841344.1 hypothetical protein [Sphingomonas sp. CA1-15]